MKYLNHQHLGDDPRIGQNFPLDFVDVSRKLGRYDDTDLEIDYIIEKTGILAGARILDVPCGMGRHAHIFSTRGYDVTAIDLSEIQIEQARIKSSGPCYIVGDMNNLSVLTGEKFDLVTNLYSSFGYNNSVKSDQLLLNGIFAVLGEGGQLVMELSDMDRAHAKLGGRTFPWRRNEFEEMNFDWDDQILFVNYYDAGGKKAHVNMRVYYKHQLMTMLFQSGFTSVEFSRGYFREASDNEQPLIVHATK